jgi:uncharacterized membrane protein
MKSKQIKQKKKLAIILHDIFEVSIIIKLVDGILQTVAGIFLFFVSSATMNSWIHTIFKKELLEDPNDALINWAVHLSQQLSLDIRIFIAIWLVVHGLANIGMFAAFQQNKKWAFDLAGILLVLFLIYQIYRLFHAHTPLLIILTVVDVLILGLMRFEYKRRFG